MKKLSSLILAVVSTMFLFAGATHAAEKFDTISRGTSPNLSGGTVMDGPTMPCTGTEEN